MQKTSSAIVKTTAQIALGELIGVAVMTAAFALTGHFDYTVVTGALLGGAGAVLNFFLMSLTVKKSAGRGTQGKNRMILSYFLRMLLMVGVMVLGIICPYFHWLAVMLPYLMPALTIYAMRILGVYRPGQENE